MSMKVIVNNVMNKALTRGAMAVAKDADTCKIECGENRCILSTSDGKAAVSTVIGCETDGTDAKVGIYTSFMKLNATVSEMLRVSDTVALDIDDKKLVVSNRMASIELPLLQEDSFVNVEVSEQDTATEFAVDGHILKHSLTVASSCTSNKAEVTSYVGMRVYKDATLDIGGLSGCTAGLIRKVPVTFNKDRGLGDGVEWKDMLLFNARAKSLSGVLPSETVTVQIRGNAGYFIFGDDNIQSIIILPLSTVNGGEWKMRGSFDSILHNFKSELHLKCKKKELENALSMIFCGSKIVDGDDAGKYGVKVTFTDKAMHLDSINGITSVELPCEGSGNWPGPLKYNATLVKDVVSLIEGSEINLYTTEKGEMIVFQEGTVSVLVLGIK